MRVLLTGGSGFVGHHFAEHFMKNTDWDIVVLDRLSYASNGFDRLRDIEVYNDARVHTLSADLCLPLSHGVKKEIGDVAYIFHLAAESHVDNSIQDATPFILSNVVGTQHLLDFAKELPDLKCLFYFSTDEVFGPAPAGVRYKEEDRHNPTNPYAASKSGGEMLVKSYRVSHNLPAIITRSMNVFGERQHPEKFIPLVINKILKGEVVSIHANHDKTISGSRFYIHARNVADGYMHILKHGVIGEDYHITGEKEVFNSDLAQLIARILGKSIRVEMTDFHSSRPGHDLRYALDGSKLAALGWVPPKTFEQSLEKTVQWFIRHPQWL